ncbi:HlyD family efflux transporter periplasmic adaptor subunit [PVC group bacterium]|nr:HlyD family efflux transporter periplasmic adaptor subunit [PVC group bacterium]
MNNKLTLLVLLSLQGCSENSSTSEQPITTETTHTSSLTNRVAIPPAVRSNLGITFAIVERRQLQNTLRAPGRFEYLPSAKREYRTMLSGRIEILVDQFDAVEQSTPLYTIDSPAWREIQQKLAKTQSIVGQLEARMRTYEPLFEAHENHELALEKNVSLWQSRVEKLEALRDAGGGKMSEFTAASASYTSAQADLASIREKTAELTASKDETLAALFAAKSNMEISVESAKSMLDIQTTPNTNLWWRDITTITVYATHSGIVETLNVTDGAWADEQSTVMTIVQPDRLRFHASGLQSDLGVLRDGLHVNIVPPTPTSAGNAVDLQNTMRGTLQLGLTGDANDRTIDLYVTPEKLSSWARPGVTAQLEIITDSTGSTELAIPLASIQQDGLTPIIFRRAPDNPNEAIRLEADLGLNDGRWVAVLSGLTDGDEVVLDGGFQLMLATSDSIQKGGHFHSDGTFHEGED